MRGAVMVAFGATALAVRLVAQSADAPAFEVASVKVNTSGSPGSSGRTNRGSVTFTNTTVRSLISNAFNDLRGNRILDGPAWIDSDRFDVNARAPEGSADSVLMPMLRTLLADRFKLQTRRETREEAIYALVTARDDKRLGPNLHPSTDCVTGANASGRAGGAPSEPAAATGLAPCGTRMLGDSRGLTIQAGKRTMADLAGLLRGVGGREVVDRTGLSGTFDFDLRYANDSVRAAAPDPTQVVPDVFTALQEQLGLKLESARGPVEYLVIERIEKPAPD
jgi:uncharacterized protein (TIGR03435 family)